MKTKIVSVLSVALMLSAPMFQVASAQSVVAFNVDSNTKIELQTQDNAISTSGKENVSGDIRNTSGNNDQSENDIEDNKNSTSSDNEGNDKSENESSADEHRSVVSAFVRSLLRISDREDGIGAEVRDIAKDQNDSATTTAEAMVKVEERGSLRKFFFGSDYKNLGVIRAELAITTNNIARLKALLDKTTNNADRLELNVQIQALENEQAKINAYIKAREDIFSLFGWLMKPLTE